MIPEGHCVVPQIVHKSEIRQTEPFCKIKIPREHITCIEKQAIASFISNLLHQGSASRYISQMGMGVVCMHDRQFPCIRFWNLLSSIQLKNGNRATNLIGYEQQRTMCRTVFGLNKLQSFRTQVCMETCMIVKAACIHIIHECRMTRVCYIIGHHAANPFQTYKCIGFASYFAYGHVLGFRSLFSASTVQFNFFMIRIKILWQPFSCNFLKITAAIVHL
ncbi:hypothetical protein D3C76_516530 [compost metagenome]